MGLDVANLRELFVHLGHHLLVYERLRAMETQRAALRAGDLRNAAQRDHGRAQTRTHARRGVARAHITGRGGGR